MRANVYLISIHHHAEASTVYKESINSVQQSVKSIRFLMQSVVSEEVGEDIIER